MRKVAAYALQAQFGTDRDARTCFQRALDLVTAWLEEKGSLVQAGSDAFAFKDGRAGRIVQTAEACDFGEIARNALIEPTQGGFFSTDVTVGCDNATVVVYTELRVAGDTSRLAPFQYDARCPKVIVDLVAEPYDWSALGTPVYTKPVPFAGTKAGLHLAQAIWHEERGLPLVLVSTQNGASITPSFLDKISADLCGLATVASVDEEAAWALTAIKGSEWSCFNGALRVYWPQMAMRGDPHMHPLWTRHSLFRDLHEPRDASYRIRKQLRRQILGLSAFSIWEPTLVRRIVSAARQAKIDEAATAAAKSGDWQPLAESYAADNARLNDALAQAQASVDELKSQVENLQLAFRYVPGADDVRPDTEPAVETVLDAVRTAQRRWPKELLFGDSVDVGASALAADAGPPKKVLKYLEALAELARARGAGELGVGIVEWLRQRGVACSAESETIRTSDAEMAKRTWSVAGASQKFEYHLKPSDVVSPDRCVRIYFDHNRTDGKVAVGWVGRHP